MLHDMLATLSFQPELKPCIKQGYVPILIKKSLAIECLINPDRRLLSVWQALFSKKKTHDPKIRLSKSPAGIKAIHQDLPEWYILKPRNFRHKPVIITCGVTSWEVYKD
jgi:hypothetical protein